MLERTITPKNTPQSRLIIFDRFWSSSLMRFFTIACLAMGLVSIVALVNNLVLLFPQYKVSYGLIFILISVVLFEIPLLLFHKDAVKWFAPKKISSSKETDNLFLFFSFDLAKATEGVFNDNKKTSVKDLILSILDTADASFIFMRLGVGTGQVKELLNNYNGNLSKEEAILKAFENAKKHKKEKVTIGDVIVAAFVCDEFFKGILNVLKLNFSDIEHIADWIDRIKKEMEERGRLFTTQNLKFTGGIGRDWAYGYTLFLKHYSFDITNAIKDHGLGLDVVGHKKEINAIKEALLSDSGNNVLVVGEPGVGKRTAVIGFAQEVTEGKTNSPLDFRHILQIDVDSLLSGVSNGGEITERIMTVFSEAASAGNVIVFIENFQNLLSSGDAGRIDLSSVLLSVLESSSIAVIGTCDVASYQQYIVSNTALNQRITRVDIEEPTEEEMLEILENVVYRIEGKTNCIIPYPAIKETYTLAEKYLINMPNPEKSINLLDRAAAHAASKKGKTIIQPQDIADYVSEKFNVPAGDAEEGERSKLLALEEEMHKSVVGQDQAISAVANALRRARAGVVSTKKPIGSFLFLGPTGVGKTETAKSLAKAYFGGEDKMIRFDMSEYQNEEDIYRFIGSNIRGENIPGALTTAVRENPFSLLLFDELEKACKDILDLFLQMLDEGFITDGTGRKVGFSNSIIIATSNAGSDLIRNAISGGNDYELVKKDLIAFLQDKGIYRPEFLNRFTAIAVFSPLNQNQIEQIASLMVDELKADLYANKGIKIEVSPDVLPILAGIGFDPQMGARPMSRTIQEKIEDMLAKKILAGELKRGDDFIISADQIS